MKIFAPSGIVKTNPIKAKFGIVNFPTLTRTLLFRLKIRADKTIFYQSEKTV